MAPAAVPIDPGHLKALDALRQRLSTLNTALSQTLAQVQSGDPLQPWPLLQQNLHLSSSAITDLAATLSTNHSVLASLHAYPLPTYPSTAPNGVPMAENVRLQLMRKKLEPTAEELIESGAKFMDQKQEKDSVDVDIDDMQDLWEWAADLVPSIIMKQAWNADYTNEELEQGYKTIRTGLRRRLNRDKPEAEDDDEQEHEAGSDEDEEDDEDDMEVDGDAGGTKDPEKARKLPAITVEETLRFMHKGTGIAPGIGVNGGL